MGWRVAESELRFEVLGTQVAQIVRNEIVAGRHQRGKHLVESTLSQRFQVSRGPIRDALGILAAEGLIEVRRRGAYVVGLSDQDISELYSLRSALETLAARLVVERRDTVNWSEFEDQVQAMHRAAETRDVHEFAAADLAFHELFYRHADHRRLHSMWAQILPTFTSLLDYTNAQDRDLHPSLESHALLLTSAREGRLELLVDELTAHLRDAQGRITTARANLMAGNESPDVAR